MGLGNSEGADERRQVTVAMLLSPNKVHLREWSLRLNQNAPRISRITQIKTEISSNRKENSCHSYY